MVPTISSLPYELLAAILEETTLLNLREMPTYTYGLSQAPEPLQTVRIQRVVRGQVNPDALRWNATDGIRRVNRTWHGWACRYALAHLYVRRWRGSERWLESRVLADLETPPSGAAVYRDPYCSLRKTVGLFSHAPALALGSSVRRIWFDGYYGAETNAMIFELLGTLTSLQYVTLPWTALRHGTREQWSRLLGGRHGRGGRNISSLELLAVDLKASEIAAAGNRVDRTPLDAPEVDFGTLTRLKIFGNSNHMALGDDDLVKIARTAANLREIHITGTSSVSIHGVMALVAASRETLQTLEHSLSGAGFEHPDPRSRDPRGPPGRHLCEEILRCRRLRNLAVSVPSLCADLFGDDPVPWAGELQIRATALCGQPETETLRASPEAQQRFWHTLERARAVMHARAQQGVDLNIEIFIDHWIFEPRLNLVHGNTTLGEALSAGSWPGAGQRVGPSSKGPYGRTGRYGKDDEEGGYSAVGEGVWREGVERGWCFF